tara:strand:- start:1112 stop:1726 length:615 start_codon:yes stop_codon:yes gene_type:complete
MASINASTSGAGGVITTADATGTLQLQSASTTVATVNAFGIGLGTGVPSSGIGITFPATSSASTDANTLDDYEEGTFSPTVIGTSTAGTASYPTQIGAYLKIGKLVYVSTYMIWTSGTGTGSLQFGNLPFTAVSSPTIYQGLVMSGVTGLAGNTAGNVLYGRVNSNDNKITCQSFGTGTTVVDTSFPYASSGTLLFSGCYIATA